MASAPPRLAERLGEILDVRPGEGRLVARVFFFGLFVSMVTTLARTTTFSLFIARFGSGQLPLVYIGLGLVSVACSYLYLRASSRLALGTVQTATFGLLILTFLALFFGLGQFGESWLIFVLPISWGILNVLVLTMFWNLAGRLFHLQQGKRLFGLFAASAEIGAIVIGVLTPALVGLVGSTGLVAIVVLLLAGALLVLSLILRTSSGPLSIQPSSGEEDSAPSFAALTSDGYVVLLFLVFTLFVVGIYFVDNIFYAQLELVIGTADEIAIFVGQFFAIVGAVSLFTQIFLTGRLVNRFGVQSMIIVTPATLGIGTILISLVGTFTDAVLVVFWLAVLTNLARCVLDAVDNAAVNVLYQPLPALERTRAQTIVDGILYPVGIGVAGGLLILLREAMALDSIALSYALLVILGLWLACAIALGRAYPGRLASALSARTLGKGALGDRTSLDLVRQTLKSPYFGSVVYALDLLEDLAPEKLPGSLESLLEHHDARVRIEAIARIERLELHVLLPALARRMASESSSSVRSASIRAIATLGGEEYDDLVMQQLRGGEPEMTRGALIGLLRNGEVEAIVTAAGGLDTLMRSANAADRCEAAHILGEAGISGLHRPLERLIGDENPRVRNAALSAARTAGRPRLWPAITLRLRDPLTHAQAAAALTSKQDAVVPLLARALADEPTATVRIRIAHILAAIGSPNALPALVPALLAAEEDSRLRGAVIAAMRACAHRISANEMHRQIRCEIEAATWLLAALADIGGDPQFHTLRRALADELGRCRTRMFDWLSMHHAGERVEKLRRGLDHEDVEQRAYALELLDVIASSALKQPLLALFDDLPDHRRLQKLNSAFPQERLAPAERLRALIASSGGQIFAWTRACAIHSAGEAGLAQRLSRTLGLVSRCDVPIVRETALWALHVAATDHPPAQAAPGVGEHEPETKDATMLTVEKVILLKSLDLFSDTQEDRLAGLAEVSAVRDCTPDETIWSAGEGDRGVHVVVSGEIAVGRGGAPAHRLGSGDMAGELSSFADGRSQSEAKAVTPARLLVLPQVALDQLVAEDPQTARRIIAVFAQRLLRAPVFERPARLQDDVLGLLQDRLSGPSSSARQNARQPT